MQGQTGRTREWAAGRAAGLGLHVLVSGHCWTWLGGTRAGGGRRHKCGQRPVVGVPEEGSQACLVTAGQLMLTVMRMVWLASDHCYFSAAHVWSLERQL